MDAPILRYADLSYLLQFCGGDDKFVREMVQLFVLKAPEDVRLMEHAIQVADYEQLKALAHKLKSSVGFLGMNGTKSVLQAIEDNILEGPIDTSLLEKGVLDVAVDCAAAVRELKDYFKID